MHNSKSLFFIAGILIVTPLFSHASELEVGTNRANYTVGDTVTVDILVNTDEAINAVQGVLIYPSDKLTYVSSSRDNSILDFWINDPQLLSSSALSFEGIAVSPGFTGTNGEVLTVTLRAVAAGTAQLDLSSASVLANDGSGTNILTTVTPQTISIVAPKPAPTLPPTQSGQPSADSVPEPVDEAIPETLLLRFDGHAPSSYTVELGSSTIELHGEGSVEAQDASAFWFEFVDENGKTISTSTKKFIAVDSSAEEVAARLNIVPWLLAILLFLLLLLQGWMLRKTRT